MVTNASADRVETVQTDFRDGYFLRDNTFQLFQGMASAPSCPRLWAPAFVAISIDPNPKLSAVADADRKICLPILWVSCSRYRRKMRTDLDKWMDIRKCTGHGRLCGWSAQNEL